MMVHSCFYHVCKTASKRCTTNFNVVHSLGGVELFRRVKPLEMRLQRMADDLTNGTFFDLLFGCLPGVFLPFAFWSTEQRQNWAKSSPTMFLSSIETL